MLYTLESKKSRDKSKLKTIFDFADIVSSELNEFEPKKKKNYAHFLLQANLGQLFLIIEVLDSLIKGFSTNICSTSILCFAN